MLAWLAALSGLLALRLALLAGIYEAHLENQEVTRVGGLWTRGFATNVGLGLSVLIGVGLVWVTVLWISGRHDRERKRMASGIRHRRVLM